MTAQPAAVTPPRPHDYLTLLAALGITFDPTLKRTRKATLPYARGITTMTVGSNVIAIGSRNSTLASIAGTMRARGATEEEILSGLRSENEANVQPPLDDAEVQSIARSISSYPPSPRASGSAHSLNDTGNAHRLVDQYGDRLRYVFEQGRWLLWDGGRWQRDTSGKIIEVAKATAKSIYHEAALATDSGLGRALAKHAGKCLDAPRIKAMIELAKSDSRVAIHAADLDRHDELLGVANGVIDLRTGKLRPAIPEDLITKHSPVTFDSAAKCPTWWRFLNRVLENTHTSHPIRKNRHLLVKYLQRVAGYALGGRTDEQVLFFLYGVGANGKTTFEKIIEDLLGVELSCQLPYDALVARKQPRGATPEIARLHGMRAVFTNEVEDGTFLAESLIKQLTGSDTMTARDLYQAPFDFEPKFKLFIAGNHKPIIRGDDHGIWRRLHLVPFKVTIPESERDPDLLDKLRAELPGILNWALRGYRLWRKQRLSPPACITDAVKEYKGEMDMFGDWIGECCIVGPKNVLIARDGYRSYKVWAQDNGYRPMGSKSFFRKLVERFPKQKGRLANLYVGLDLDPSAMISGGGCGGSNWFSSNPP